MELVLRSAIRAVEDLTAPGIPKLFFICLGLTALAAVAAITGGLWAYDAYILPSVPNEETLGASWLASIVGAAAWFFFTALLIVPIFMLFWSLMIVIAGFFDEHIAEKIEQHRYPNMAIGQSHAFWPEFWQDVRFTLKVLFFNLLLVLIPLFWPFWPILFPLVNGYMLGKYFFRMAGKRHIGRKAADALAKKHWLEILLGGVAIVFASGVPFLNLVVPFWGVSMMVHLYHMIDKPAAQEVLPAAGE